MAFLRQELFHRGVKAVRLHGELAPAAVVPQLGLVEAGGGGPQRPMAQRRTRREAASIQCRGTRRTSPTHSIHPPHTPHPATTSLAKWHLTQLPAADEK